MKIKYILDSGIIRLASKGGRLGLVTTYRDLYIPHGLNINDIRPITGGVYDSRIFGPIQTRGNVANQYSRYGCIEMPVRYCIETRKKSLLSFLNGLGVLLAQDEDGTNKPFSKLYKGSKAYSALDFMQFNVVDNKIVATTNITDSSKCSYEGIIYALQQIGLSNAASEVENQFTNKYVLVLPIACRKFSVRMLNGEAIPNNARLTQDYRYLLYGIDTYNKLISDPTYSDDTEEANARAALLEYKLRCLANSLTTSSALVKGGKTNFSRNMQKSRMKGSMRAVIVPDPNIQIDEIVLPLHLAYEMCDKEFIEYLMSNFGFSKAQARVKFNKPYESHTLDIFSHYIDGTIPKKDENGKVPDDFNSIEWIEDPMGPKYAIINRQPSLHQLSLLSCKVKLTKDNAIKYPLNLCAPLGADFDGDTISVIAVDKTMTDVCNKYMSPHNLIYWTKNNAPLFMPSHESMMGSIIMTKAPTKEEIEGCYDIEDAKKKLLSEFRKRPSERKFSFNTQINFEKIDGKDTEITEPTTIGRAILSMIFDNDPYFIERMLFNSDPKKVQLDADLMANLILHLAEFMQSENPKGPTREERIKELQHWTLMAATKSGSTAPKLSQLYQTVNEEMTRRIREVEDDDSLDQVTKSVRIAKIYEEYVDRNRAKGLSSDLVRSVIESSRSKESQLVEMTSAVMVVDPQGDAHVTQSTFVGGMLYEDYVNTVISNRGLQAVKHEAVPSSGYLTRQLLYSCDNWYLDKAQTDPENEGLLLPDYLADGRTMTDGTIYHFDKSLLRQKNRTPKYVKVRSIITSTKPRFVVTPDMLNSIYHKHLDDNYQIGASFSTSLTEGISQSMLGLKHGGVLRDYDPETKLVAPFDCELSMDDNFITLTGTGQVYTYPKPKDFCLVSADSRFKKGDLVGLIPNLYTPGMKGDSIINFIGAAGTTMSQKYQRNKVTVSDCYCVKEGEIKYGTKQYKDKKSGELRTRIVITIGGLEYNYNPNCLYHVPDGTHVNVGRKICSGVEDMSYVFSHKVTDRNISYMIFYDQVSRFIKGIATEVLEFIYAVIFTDFDEDTKENKNVSRNLTAVLAKDGGTFQKMARKSPVKFLEDIDPFEGEIFTADEMSNRMLLSLINRFYR